MKFICITTCEDTLTGMRLGGIEGTLVATKEQALAAFNAAKEDEEIPLVFLCSQVAAMIGDELEEMKFTCSRPVVLEIPGPNDPAPGEDAIAKYIREAVGIG